MDNNSWLLKCSPSALQPSTSQEVQDQRSGHYFCTHVGQDLRGQVHGRMPNTALPNSVNLSSCHSRQVDLDSSFLALLSGPASLLHSDFQEIANSKPFNSSIKTPVEIGRVSASPTGTENPLTCSRQPTENGSYQDMQSGPDTCPTVLSWAAASSSCNGSSVFQNCLSSANIGLKGSGLAKTGVHDVVLGNDTVKDFASLRGEQFITSFANAVKLRNVNNQMPQNFPSESEFSVSCMSSPFPSPCPRVFCMDRSGDLLLSSAGLLGILCSCHCFHMSVSKFCEHSGLWNVNPGDAVRMESGETIAQWRKLYFQKFGIRIPEDQSVWDWPEGLPLTASLMRSGVSMFNMSKNSDCNLGVSEVLARSGRSLSDVPKSMLMEQISVVDALHDKLKRNVQEGHKSYLKGLVGSSPRNTVTVEDHHATDCSIFRWSTIPNFAGRGQESVCEPMHDLILKSGSLASAQPTLQNPKTLVENSDIGRCKEALGGAAMDRAASFSSIELKLGQPYQHSQSPVNSVLPLIGPQFYSPLVNSQNSFSQEQLIHNATSFQGEEESRQSLPHAAALYNSAARRDQDHLRYGNCASNKAVDATELGKLNLPNTSVVSLSQNYSLSEGSPSKAINNIQNNHLYVMPVQRNCESRVFKFEPNNFPWNGGNGLDRQCLVSESGFLKHAENDKEMGCFTSSTYIAKDSHSNKQKWIENAKSFNGVVQGSTYSTFPSMLEKSCYPHCLSNLPPDMSDAANFANCLEKVPCVGSGGSTDLVFLRSMGSSLVSAPSTSTHIPRPTLAVPNQESVCMGSCLFDDNLRLLALRQLQDLSKQHAISSEKNVEQSNCINATAVELQHTSIGPSISKEQRHLPNIAKKQDVVMESDQSGPGSMIGNDLVKSTYMTGLNRWCNHSTLTQGLPIQCKEFGLQCQLSCTSLQNEHTSLRLGRCENNIIQSNEDENCYLSKVYFQHNCSHTAHAKCIGEKCNLRGQKDTNFLRKQNGSVSCKTPTSIASDCVVPEENTVSFDQNGMLEGKHPKNITWHMSQWKDVPSQLKMVCDVDCAKRSTVASDRHELGQLEDAAAKCSDGAVLTADSFKEQDMSNISSGCSTPAVTQASIEVTNVDSSTVVRYAGCVNNLVVDEGSGIDKCWSSDDALESDRSSDFYGSTLKTNFVHAVSRNVAVNKSSRSLLDEVKLMDSLTWKKVRNQKHHGIPVHAKINWSEESHRGLKTAEGNGEMNLHKLDAPSGPADPLVHGSYPECNRSADLSCLSKNVQLVASGPDSTWTSGVQYVKTNPKPINSTPSFTRTPSRKRDLQRLYHAGDGEDDRNAERNLSGNSFKIFEISGRKKFRTFRNADLCMQFQRQESSQDGSLKAAKYDSLGCIETFSTQQVNPCYQKAKPVVCGKYGEIINGNLIGDVSRPVKIVSLGKVLKTASRCPLPKNCKPGLISSKKMRINFSWSNACFDKLSNLTKGKKPMSNNALAFEEMNIASSLEERKISFSSDDEQSTDELSMLEKSEDISGRGCRIVYTNAPNQSKLRYKETRKRSLYELTLEGNNIGPKTVSQKKIFKCKPKMRWEKILKNSDRSHVNGSQKFDPERCAMERTLKLVCCVCGSSNKDEANCLLECGGCSIRVHQACYGVSKVPKGQWYCRPCRTNSKNIVCVLCGYGGGAMTLALQSRIMVKGLLKAWNLETQCTAKKAILLTENLHDELSILHGSGTAPENSSYPVLRAVNIEPSTSTVCNMDVQKQLDVLSNFKLNNSITAGVLDSTVKQWVHMVCGLWTPGTRCPNVNTMSAFDVSGASCPRANVVCSLCNRPGGSCIQCRVANCHVKFHPWCAHQKGLLQSEAEGVDNENVGFYGRCTLHATYMNEESAHDAATLDVGDPGEKEVSCARTEGYKGRKWDGFWHNTNSRSTGKGGCIVPQEQFDAWIHINGQKSCAQGILKFPTSEKEHDCRKEYIRYKEGRGWKHLVVYKSGIHALGLYTSRFISRGEMVVEYVGEIVGLRVSDKRENEYQSGRKLQYKSACYFFRIDKEHIIDATRKGGIARFVNHSCLPNCVAKIISVRNEKKVVFFAERDIYPGEEITYDYHFNHEDEGKKIPCFCNSKNCRRYLN